MCLLVDWFNFCESLMKGWKDGEGKSSVISSGVLIYTTIGQMYDTFRNYLETSVMRKLCRLYITHYSCKIARINCHFGLF